MPASRFRVMTVAVTERIVLIIGGGIAAYKCLELIRRLRERGIAVRAVMTRAAQQFVTPLSVGALSNDRVFTELFDLDDEREIGHIRLSREADRCRGGARHRRPAGQDGRRPCRRSRLLRAAGHRQARAGGARHEPAHVAASRDPAQCRRCCEADGMHFVGPDVGEMAERGEAGARPPGRGARADRGDRRRCFADPRPAAVPAVTPRDASPSSNAGAVRGEARSAGRHVLVTSGPTHEPIDPVRYIANRSSGKQGAAIAAEAAALGARVTLVTGPTSVPIRAGVDGRARRDGAADAGRRARGAAGRHRHLRRRRRRLARRRRRRREKIKKGGQGPAQARAGREPRHPQDHRRRAARQAAAARHRLCRRDRRTCIEYARQEAQGQGRRLDRRQRRLARDRHHGRRPQHRASRHRGRRARAGQSWTRARWRGAWCSAPPSGSPSITAAGMTREARRSARSPSRVVRLRARPRPRRCPPTSPTAPRAWICWPRCRSGAAAACSPARARWFRPGSSLELPPRLRGPGAPALGPRAAPRRHRAQQPRHHRQRLSRRGAGAARSISATPPSPIARGERIAQLVVQRVERPTGRR